MKKGPGTGDRGPGRVSIQYPVVSGRYSVAGVADIKVDIVIKVSQFAKLYKSKAHSAFLHC